MERIRIDELAKRLLENLPPGLRSGMGNIQSDLETNFRAVLRANLGKLDLVARDEFDAQSRVLERTRKQLAELEDRVKAIEAADLGNPGAAPTAAVATAAAPTPATPTSATPSAAT